MALWKIQPTDWQRQPVGQSVVLEATDKGAAIRAAFRLPGFPQGPADVAPAEGERVGDTLPCGCRYRGLTRVRNGVSYQTVRTPRQEDGRWVCEGCDRPR